MMQPRALRFANRSIVAWNEPGYQGLTLGAQFGLRFATPHRPFFLFPVGFPSRSCAVHLSRRPRRQRFIRDIQAIGVGSMGARPRRAMPRNSLSSAKLQHHTSHRLTLVCGVLSGV
jgi:hypothetical protein